MTDNQADDESLGVEQLPQDELDASPGDEDIQAPNLDVEAVGATTTSDDSADQAQDAADTTNL